MSTLKVNTIQEADGSAFPLGKILQVVQHSTSTRASTTGSSFVATGLSGSITTTSANSKILVLVSQNFSVTSTNNSTGGGINVNRVISGTETVLDDGPRNSAGPYGLWVAQDSGSTTSHYSRYNIQYLDSPSQTAGTSITYNTKMAAYNSNDTIVAQVGQNITQQGTSYLNLMEVSA